VCDFVVPKANFVKGGPKQLSNKNFLGHTTARAWWGFARAVDRAPIDRTGHASQEHAEHVRLQKLACWLPWLHIQPMF